MQSPVHCLSIFARRVRQPHYWIFGVRAPCNRPYTRPSTLKSSQRKVEVSQGKMSDACGNGGEMEEAGSNDADVLVQYIVVRKDLLKPPHSWSHGALMASACHASVGA